MYDWKEEDLPRGHRRLVSHVEELHDADHVAFAGSDVSGLRTTATKTPDGKYYIINGTKKWITNGTFCDYFVTACRTEGGFSVILVPRQEGVETSPIKTSFASQQRA
jgi:alkylation response protein AidB-like acyl-CoA dehydrogenase